MWRSLTVLSDNFDANSIVAGLIGVVGAILGSAVSVIWTEIFNLRSRRRIERNLAKANAYSLLGKLDAVYADSKQVKEHLGEGIRSAILSGVDHVFMTTIPIRRNDDSMRFAPEEMSMVIEYAGVSLFNNTGRLDEMYNTLKTALKHYELDRKPVIAKLRPVIVNGLVGSIVRDPIREVTFLPEMNDLDDQVLQLHQMAVELETKAFEALRGLVLARGRPFGARFSVSVADPNGAVACLASKDAPNPSRWWRFRRWKWWKVWKWQWWKVWRWPRLAWAWFG